MPHEQLHQSKQKNELRQATNAKNDSSAFSPEIHPLLFLQKQIGNAQIARMMADEDALQRLPEVGKAGGPVSHQLANRITKQLGKGTPLPEQKRQQMESNFGQSMEAVRLHTDRESQQLNQQISARAFTLGNDVFFGQKAHPNDNQLLSHELTHVVQQQSMPVSGSLTVGPSNDRFEQQARSSVSRMEDQTEPLVQRDFWDEMNLGNLSGIGGLGLSGLQAAGEIANTPLAKMMGTTGGAITDASALGPLGGLASVAGLYTGTRDMLDEDKPWYERGIGGMSAFSGATGTASTIASMFGSSAFAAGGSAGLTAGAGSALTGGGAGLLSGAGAATALGSAGAVLGAGAAGYGAGRLLDEGVGALGRWATGDEQGDYTISGQMADRMTSLDRAVSGVFADPDEPAYTQTLGWKIASWLDD